MQFFLVSRTQKLNLRYLLPILQIIACLFFLHPLQAQMSQEVQDMLNNLDGRGTPKQDDVLDLEAMMRDLQNATDTARKKDTFIRYNPVINEEINLKKFNLTGKWKIVYKEYTTQSMHITPYTDPTEQKKCLFGEMIFGKNFLYGNTTCLANFLLFREVHKKNFSIDKAIRSDNVSPKLRYIYAAIQDRFNLEHLNQVQFEGEAFETSDTYTYYILNDSTMFTLFDGYVFFLQKIEQVDPDISIETAAKTLGWEKDLRGFKMVVGKNTGSAYVFLDSSDTQSNDPNAQIHFIYYPPKLGMNYFAIHNLYINNKTGQMDSKLFYSNQETINNIKHIYIRPKHLLSNMIRLTINNSMNKKYSWGVKYKLQERNIRKKKKEEIEEEKEKTEEQEKKDEMEEKKEKEKMKKEEKEKKEQRKKEEKEKKEQEKKEKMKKKEAKEKEKKEEKEEKEEK